MAEVGKYWRPGDTSVNCPAVIMKYLRSAEPSKVKQIVEETGATGDSWKSYARRWALCHVLMHNGNYAERFRALGQAYLAGRDETFEDAFGPVAAQLEFEHQFFTKHLCQGFRADLCTWNWSKSFAGLKVGARAETKVRAARGWQPTGVTLVAGRSYTYIAKGRWRLTVDSEPVSAEGDKKGAGRLVGVVLNKHQLGDAFELGPRGSLVASGSGDLYLRCRDDWGALADNNGEVAVELAGQADR
jgi:hypothetical protein